jgi:hypothetical protein
MKCLFKKKSTQTTRMSVDFLSQPICDTHVPLWNLLAAAETQEMHDRCPGTEAEDWTFCIIELARKHDFDTAEKALKHCIRTDNTFRLDLHYGAGALPKLFARRVALKADTKRYVVRCDNKRCERCANNQ